MSKFNYTNPNSSILEAFTDEWPDPVETIDTFDDTFDVDVAPTEITADDNFEDDVVIDDVYNKIEDAVAKKDAVLTEAADEAEEAEEEPANDEADIEAEDIAEDEADDAETEAEETENAEEADEANDEPANISTEDFLAQIRDILDANMNNLDDASEEDQDKLASFNDGLNKAFDLVKEFLLPENDEEPEIKEIDTPEESEEDTEQAEAATDEVTDEPEVVVDEVKFEFPEE